MEIKMFYKSQVDVANAINEVVDQYWQSAINEANLIENVQKLYEHNQQKMIKFDEFTTVLKQKCGKRRLEVIEKILKLYCKIDIK